MNRMKRDVELDIVKLVRVDLGEPLAEEYCREYIYHDKKATKDDEIKCYLFEWARRERDDVWSIDVESFNDDEKKKAIEIIEDLGCTVLNKEDVLGGADMDIYFECHEYDFLPAIFEQVEDRALEFFEEEKFEDWAKDDIKSLDADASELPIPLKCSGTFAYPHGGGYFYYAKCNGKKEYPLNVEGTAKSLKDIYDTIKGFCELVT